MWSSHHGYLRDTTGGWWKDINLNGASLGRGASAPSFAAIYPSGGIQAPTFDGTATMNQLFACEEINHDYAEGTDVIVHIHWLPTTANAGNVKWFLEYNWLPVEAVAGAPTVLSVVSAAGGVAWAHNKAAWPTISGAGKKIGSAFNLRLYRDPTDVADTYSDGAALLNVGIHYQLDTTGSLQAATKI